MVGVSRDVVDQVPHQRALAHCFVAKNEHLCFIKRLKFAGLLGCESATPRGEERVGVRGVQSLNRDRQLARLIAKQLQGLCRLTFDKRVQYRSQTTVANVVV